MKKIKTSQTQVWYHCNKNDRILEIESGYLIMTKSFAYLLSIILVF